MSKPTPGPWRIVNDYEIFGVTGEIGVINHSSLNAQAFADARLIAAAPQLLEACKAVLDLLDRLAGDGAVQWLRPPYCAAGVHESASERLEAVIAQAEGGGQ